jgi:hypothetical protein
MQPNSIRKFTLFFFLSLVVMLVATAMSFEELLAIAEAQAGAQLGSGILIGSVLFWAAILLLLWYLVARKGFVIAKWIFVLLVLYNVVTSFGIFAGGLTISKGMSLLATVLQVAAAYYLFQPDAKAWFAGERATEAPSED